MSDQPPGIYLFIQFNWPTEITKEMAQAARHFHDILGEADWIEEIIAASGGLGGGPSSIWVLRLANYAALDRLLKDREDQVSQAYMNFFSHMVDMHEFIREEVIFR